MKMKERNTQLQDTLGKMATKEVVKEVRNIPKEDTKNLQGRPAYSLSDELRLVTLLNTTKIEPQYYRSENAIIKELRDLVEKIGMNDPLFLAQAIVYSRCMGEGMRSINHLAAALASPFLSGQEFAKRFYGRFDRKKQGGGCIYRVDDLSEIKDAYAALNSNSVLSNAMKKGFRTAIESFDAYQLAKYRKTIIDVSNLVHPNPERSNAIVTINNEKIKVLDAIMKGMTVSADTWEVAQSEAGQEVAKAVKEGKITKEQAEEMLSEQKADNWESLLNDGKLPVIAALRNIRNILKNPRKEMIDKWCELITDEKKIRAALVLPIYFDLAYDVVDQEFSHNDYANKVRQALLDGYNKSIPNLEGVFQGKTLVIVDNSGSMGSYCVCDGKNRPTTIGWGSSDKLGPRTAGYKAGLIAATIAKAAKADIIRFGSSAYRYSYNKNENVFSLAKSVCQANDGWTNPAAAFDLITRERAHYDRIIFISDNEVNGRLTSDSYKRYIHDVCSPYIYGIDLCGYGTTPLAGDKISYFFGYGPALYDAIKAKEFNASDVIDRIRQIEI